MWIVRVKGSYFLSSLALSGDSELNRTIIINFARRYYSLMRVLFLLGLLSCFQVAFAQNAGDVALLRKLDNADKSETEVSYLLKNEKRVLIKYNPLAHLFAGSLFFYQSVISRQISAECPYEISCSNFARQAIASYGLIKGVALASDRMMRCNKMAGADIHELMIGPDKKIIDPLETYRLRK